MAEVRLGIERNTQSPEDFLLIPIFGEGFAELNELPAFLRQHQGIDLRDRAKAPGEIARLIDLLKRDSQARSILSEYWQTQKQPAGPRATVNVFRRHRAGETERGSELRQGKKRGGPYLAVLKPFGFFKLRQAEEGCSNGLAQFLSCRILYHSLA